MTLSIITINRNNAAGLEKTMKSVLSQSCSDFEYVVVDGASTDNSVDVIRRFAVQFGNRLKWISEPDKGIYNAMNKGIGMATGDYVQFLNSGDCLAAVDVTLRMLSSLAQNGFPTILYGNMLKLFSDGRVLRDRCFAGQDITFLGFYTGTLNHSPAYIRKDLFERYGLYDESRKIVSDWKWYLQSIVLGKERPEYTDIDVSLYDMYGISETNTELNKAERKQVLSELINPAILVDYDQWAFPIQRMKRIKRHPWANGLVMLIERCLFIIERIRNSTKKDIKYF